MRVGKHILCRFFNRGLMALVLLCLAQLVTAQPATPISPSVVLVLKLVSSTHVKPTTGIVISDEGLVLVPADFASLEGEIIVLDGGTDILSHGRPAKIFEETISGKLAVLSVDGLKRPGIKFADNLLNADSDLHLEAFPPAEYIAKGAEPLWVSMDILRDEQSSQISVTPATPLPYVTGAIIDHCGFLAGVSLSSGPQSLETTKTTRTVFNKELTGILQDMQVSAVTAHCASPVQSSESPVVLKPESDTVNDSADAVETTQATEDIDAVEPGATDQLVSETVESPPQGVTTSPAKQVVTGSNQRPSLWRSVPLWLVLAAIIILAVLIWKAIYFIRLQRTGAGHITTAEITGHVQPASDEPVTAPLETSAGESIVKPRSVPVPDLDIPDMGKRPGGCDGVLLVEGLLDTDSGFRHFCFVNTEQISIVIGRGDTDIAIEHAAISRAHVRIESDGELITISDLGSRNGTFIGDIPCLPGEVMYLNEDDEIYLGDLKLTVRVIKQEAEWA